MQGDAVRHSLSQSKTEILLQYFFFCINFASKFVYLSPARNFEVMSGNCSHCRHNLISLREVESTGVDSQMVGFVNTVINRRLYKTHFNC
jgi:hypothetical protein